METFTPVIDNLIDNIPPPKYKNINLILDGGAFNGSYHHGALMYHAQLEKKNYIKINNISGTSVGSLIGFLYIIDSIDLGFDGFNIMRETFKNTCTFCRAEQWLAELFQGLPSDTYKICNNRLYITYYDLTKCKQRIISNYKSNDHLMRTIIKSMFIPYIFNGNFAYKNKYIDGFYPYIFKPEPNIKNIYINLQSIYKFVDIVKISHDKNCYRRIIDAINDTHTFYLLNKTTVLCSYVEDWNTRDKIVYNIRLIISKILQMFIVLYRGIIINIPERYRNVIIDLKLYNLLLGIVCRLYKYIVKRFLID